MRTLMAVLLAITLLAGCSNDPSEPAAETPSAEVGEPQDTLPVLGRWVSTESMAASGSRLVLTLSDDNTYTATDGCTELTGRWELTDDQVLPTPDDSGSQCGDPKDDAPVELPESLVVDGDTLTPLGAGIAFERD
ncbi:hypothetical protein AFL01nite_17140 [Aeromicrobium flavum]|uniref:DUF306 domain-containing protein n=1 Tax=Aeromicrobium flavum TaxID=416568 RepID=A0A512HVA6_9ACTN|nr:hypothetical protein [Aeromicrobium flavum]GEO89387.1 hypothetical protein AFL01nite_17140 [Aeromicrobium flavum]